MNKKATKADDSTNLSRYNYQLLQKQVTQISNDICKIMHMKRAKTVIWRKCKSCTKNSKTQKRAEADEAATRSMHLCSNWSIVSETHNMWKMIINKYSKCIWKQCNYMDQKNRRHKNEVYICTLHTWLRSQQLGLESCLPNIVQKVKFPGRSTGTWEHKQFFK